MTWSQAPVYGNLSVTILEGRGALGDIPSIVGITLNEIHAHESIYRQATEADQEEPDQQKGKRPLFGMLARVAEQQRPGDTSNQGEGETDEMRLGFALAPVLLSLPVRDLVGQVATEEPDEWRGDHDGQHHEAQLVEVELEGEDDGRGVLLRRGQRADEDGVERDDPQHVGEEGRFDGVDDRLAREAPLGLDVEDAEVVLVRAIAVLGVLQARTVLARTDGVNLLASCCTVSVRVPCGRHHACR